MVIRRRNLLLVLFLLVALVLAGCAEEPAPEASKVPTGPVRKAIAEIQLIGEESVTVEYGDSWEDTGATAVGYYEDAPEEKAELSVETKGDVDLSKLGSYTVTYSAKYEGAAAEVSRTVTVVDTQAPVIQLTTDPDGYTLPNQKYQEEGFTATDNYDGDITHKVIRTECEDGTTVTYTVTDTAGNQTEVVRTVVYDDRTAPVITLKGEKEYTITAGESWSEPGFSAVDEVEGDLTGKVVRSGSVDCRRAGTYTLGYTVTDAYGNTATTSRTVTVKAVPKPEPEPETPSADGNGKVIYLTFDDGPGKHTERLLQILDQYDVKVTFFVCNTGRLELLDDMVQAGHTVAIHSKSHNYSQIYSSDDAFFEDFNAMRDLITQYSGVAPTLSRFPGGSSNGVSKKYNVGIMTRLTQAVQDLGYQYVDWNIDSDDAGGTKTAEGVFQNVTEGIAKSKRDHLVVLQHDIFGYSVDAVEQIILWGLENGYTFQALDATSPVCHHSVNN